MPLWAGFMKVATKGDKPEWLRGPRTSIGVERVPRVRQAAGRGLRPRRGGQPRRLAREAVDDLHRVFRQGHAADRDRARCTAGGFLDRAGRRLRQGLGPAADARRCDRPAGAAGSAEHRGHRGCARACAGAAASRASPRRSAASGRASSAAARDKKDEDRKKDEPKQKVRAGDSDSSQPRHAFPTSRRSSRVLLDLVARAAAARTLPPSLIFAGPDGVGKRLLRSRWRSCSIARAVRRGGRRARARRVRQCARLPPHRARRPRRRARRSSRATPVRSRSIRCATAIERSAYRPFEGRRRVVIIDDAEAMERRRRMRC